jgi:hypothetical protein
MHVAFENRKDIASGLHKFAGTLANLIGSVALGTAIDSFVHTPTGLA